MHHGQYNNMLAREVIMYNIRESVQLGRTYIGINPSIQFRIVGNAFQRGLAFGKKNLPKPRLSPFIPPASFFDVVGNLCPELNAIAHSRPRNCSRTWSHVSTSSGFAL